MNPLSVPFLPFKTPSLKSGKIQPPIGRVMRFHSSLTLLCHFPKPNRNTMKPNLPSSQSHTLSYCTYAIKMTETSLLTWIDQQIHTLPEFNNCWLTESDSGICRIQGLGLHGDILVSIESYDSANVRISLDYRQGDRRLVLALFKNLPRDTGRRLPATKAPKTVWWKKLAYCLQNLLGEETEEGFLITHSAIESALECNSDEYSDAIVKILELAEVRRCIDEPSLNDCYGKERIEQYLEKHPNPKVIIHRGRKVTLPHRLCLKISAITTLHIHYAWDGRLDKHIIGWVDAFIEC
jgi:hypothetical protein